MSVDPLELGGSPLVNREGVGQIEDVPAIEQTFLDDIHARSLCTRYEESKARIQEGGAWAEAIADFIPFIDAYARDDDHEDLARGLLARLLELSYRTTSSHDKPVEEFAIGLFEMLSQLRHVPDALMRPRLRPMSKRQPSFFESVYGTIKRYRFIEKLPQSFQGIADGIIVGGSMGYGPFFSVRDGERNNDPSDIDTIIVLSDDFIKEDNWQPLLQAEYLDNSAKISLLSRFALFTAMQEAGDADIISQRFEVIGRGFNMSAHFMPSSFFARMNGSQLRDDVTRRENTTLVVRDYKPRLFEHAVCAQRSFDGSVHEYEVPEQTAVEQGFLAQLPGYVVADGKFYPGLYQNLISPEFEVLYDSNGSTTEVVEGFRQIVLDYIDEEKKQGHIANVPLSHIRGSLFAPGRYDHRANLARPVGAQRNA